MTTKVYIPFLNTFNKVEKNGAEKYFYGIGKITLKYFQIRLVMRKMEGADNEHSFEISKRKIIIHSQCVLNYSLRL